MDDDDDKDEVDDQDIPMEERLAKMPFWSAALAGYLNGAEYNLLMCWFGGLFLVMLMGIVLSYTTSPPCLGLIIWSAVWIFL